MKKYKKINISKSFFLFSILFLMILGMVAFFSKSGVRAHQIDEYGGIGKSIRYSTWTNKYEVAPFEILDRKFYEKNLKNLDIIKENRLEFSVTGASTINSITRKINSNIERSSEISASFGDLEVQLAFLIKNNFSYSYKYRNSSYFHALSSKYYSKYVMMPDAASISKLKDNLSSNFVTEIEKLLKSDNQKDYDDFFSRKGSHLFAAGHFGGSITALNAFFSDQHILKKTISSEISAKFNLIVDEIKAKKTTNINFNSILDKYNSQISSSFIYNKKGGDYNLGTSFNSILENFGKWEQSIINNEEVIDIPKHGVIPFWDILPRSIDTYYSREKLRNHYNSFIREATELPVSMEDKMLEYNGRPISYSLLNIDRNRPSYLENVPITDAYYLDNPVKDTVKIPTTFTTSFLKLHGYKNVKVKMKHDVAEIYDGWQYCALYDFREEEESKITEKYHDHGYHQTITTYKTIEVIFDSFDIDKLLNNNKFFIRYRGSGYGRDDWKNRNVCVYVEFTR